jgi:phage tail-like protein
MAELFDSTTIPEDPLVVFQFQLDIDGVEAGYFTAVSGIGSESEVVEMKHNTPDGKVVIRKVPGEEKWSDITLKRGITTNMEMWIWRRKVVDGNVTDARTNGTITMFDQAGEAKARWNFINGWPSKVSGPELKSDDNSFGVEEIVIVHEGIWRDT